MTSRNRVLIAMLCLAAAPAPAEPVRAMHSQAELIADVDSVKAGQPFWVGIRIQLESDWHTYWKNPGDAGMASRIAWDLPPDWKAGPIEWPAPSRFESEGLVGFGYSGEVTLLSQLTPPQGSTDDTVRIAAKADWLICRDVCVPARAEIEASLRATTGEAQPDARTSNVFAMARASLPSKSTGWRFRARPEPGGLRVMAIPLAGLGNTIESVEFFPERQNAFSYDPVSWYRTPTGYAMEIKSAPTATSLPMRLVGVLTTPDGWLGPGSAKALEVDVPVR